MTTISNTQTDVQSQLATFDMAYAAGDAAAMQQSLAALETEALGSGDEVMLAKVAQLRAVVEGGANGFAAAVQNQSLGIHDESAVIKAQGLLSPRSQDTAFVSSVMTGFEKIYGTDKAKWPEGLVQSGEQLQQHVGLESFGGVLAGVVNGFRVKEELAPALGLVMSMGSHHNRYQKVLGVVEQQIARGLPEGALRAGLHFVESPINLALPIWGGSAATRLVANPLTRVAEAVGASREALRGFFAVSSLMTEVLGFTGTSRGIAAASVNEGPSEGIGKELVGSTTLFGGLKIFGAMGRVMAELLPKTELGKVLSTIWADAVSVTGLASMESAQEAAGMMPENSQSAGERLLRAFFLHNTLKGLGAISETRDVGGKNEGLKAESEQIIKWLQSMVNGINEAFAGAGAGGAVTMSKGKPEDVFANHNMMMAGGDFDSALALLRGGVSELEAAQKAKQDLTVKESEFQAKAAEIEALRKANVTLNQELAGVRESIAGVEPNANKNFRQREKELLGKIGEIDQIILDKMVELEALTKENTALKEKNGALQDKGPDVEKLRKVADLVRPTLSMLEALPRAMISGAEAAYQSLKGLFEIIDPLLKPKVNTEEARFVDTGASTVLKSLTYQGKSFEDIARELEAISSEMATSFKDNLEQVVEDKYEAEAQLWLNLLGSMPSAHPLLPIIFWLRTENHTQLKASLNLANAKYNYFMSDIARRFPSNAKGMQDTLMPTVLALIADSTGMSKDDLRNQARVGRLTYPYETNIVSGEWKAMATDVLGKDSPEYETWALKAQFLLAALTPNCLEHYLAAAKHDIDNERTLILGISSINIDSSEFDIIKYNPDNIAEALSRVGMAKIKVWQNLKAAAMAQGFDTEGPQKDLFNKWALRQIVTHTTTAFLMDKLLAQKLVTAWMAEGKKTATQAVIGLGDLKGISQAIDYLAQVDPTCEAKLKDKLKNQNTAKMVRSLLDSEKFIGGDYDARMICLAVLQAETANQIPVILKQIETGYVEIKNQVLGMANSRNLSQEAKLKTFYYEVILAGIPLNSLVIAQRFLASINDLDGNISSGLADDDVPPQGMSVGTDWIRSRGTSDEQFDRSGRKGGVPREAQKVPPRGSKR